ncbi:MAG: hypothetical protein VW810_01990 [Pelagibacteraceae bacterium]|jgi:hypothetical protein|tara:strand:+ start:108 stop:386 length:279 start_codon:yes stop_codon:yes gene_type:complete
MFKNILISLFILILGSFFTNVYKNQSKDLENKINEKNQKIYELKKNNDIEIKENIFLKSPENIKKLADRYLDKNYIIFDSKNIEYLKIDEKK